MKSNSELVVFGEIKKTDDKIGEWWSARDLQCALGYAKWENFLKVIKKAISSFTTSPATASYDIKYHFLEVGKMVTIGSGAPKEILDYKLSRYACYLIAQNGDATKPEIALAQTYFSYQTIKQEQTDLKLEEIARLEAREKYRESDKKLSEIVKDRDVNRDELARIKSHGDKVLFGGNDTRAMKKKMGLPDKSKKPLVDVLPTISITAKQLANEMTHINTIQNDLRGFPPIDTEHATNNAAVRQTLTDRGIKPEDLPPEPDIAKIKRKAAKKLKEENGR
jgi:DNA-damage-inducible protein D